MDDNYKNIEEYNPNKKHKILIVFDEMITDILSNKKHNPTDQRDITLKDFMNFTKSVL